MEFTIKDRITTAEPNAVLSYALDYRAEFEVDDEWKDKVVTARFVHSNGEYIDVVLDNFGCNIPLFPKGVLWVGAYTDAFTSTAVPVPIGVTIKDLGEHEAIPPTADVYQQIIALIEAGRLKGDKGDPGDDYIITESDYQAIADRVPQPDLSEYVKNTDYATASKGGVVKVGSYSTDVLDGKLSSKVLTNAEYNASGTRTFVSKGTLENLLAERLKEPQFELIEEITLTEDTHTVRRVTEPNGEAYNFNRLLVFVESEASTTTSQLNVTIGENTVYTSNGVSTTKRTSQYGGIANGVIQEAYGRATSSTLGTLNSSFYVAKEVQNNLALNLVRIEPSTSSVNIPSGTTIKIYGIRA